MIKNGGRAGLLLFVNLVSAFAQQTTVKGRVEIAQDAARPGKLDAPNVAVWLTPLPATEASAQPPQRHVRLVQRNKTFQPHVLVVQVGSVVDFPNLDPFFHNVFSLFDGKRFDLGLYEAGATRSVHFDRAGICYIFCNIHPQMSATVVVVKTPYYGVSDHTGSVMIPNVPPGRYQLEVWDEGVLPETLKGLSREITISENDRSLGSIRLTRTGDLRLAHKNKYGRDYESPMPSSPAYSRP